MWHWQISWTKIFEEEFCERSQKYFRKKAQIGLNRFVEIDDILRRYDSYFLIGGGRLWPWKGSWYIGCAMSIIRMKSTRHVQPLQWIAFITWVVGFFKKGCQRMWSNDEMLLNMYDYRYFFQSSAICELHKEALTWMHEWGGRLWPWKGSWYIGCAMSIIRMKSTRHVQPLQWIAFITWVVGFFKKGCQRMWSNDEMLLNMYDYRYFFQSSAICELHKEALTWMHECTINTMEIFYVLLALCEGNL